MAEKAPRLKVLGQSATAHLALAKGLYQRGLYGQALAELDRILVDNPEQPLAHFLKGVILSRLCDYAAAERSLSDAVALDDAMFPAWVGLAFAQQEQGRHRDALLSIESGLRVEPKDANGHLMRGTILTAMGKPRQAIGALRDALKYNPQLTLARYKLGRLLADAGQTDEAIGQIVTAMRLNPLNAEARVALGDIYRSQRKFVEAVREYRAASEIAPQQADPHAKIGETFLEEGLLKEALASFRTATRLNPKHVDSFLNVARIYLQTGRDQEALETLRAAQEADPYYPLTRQLLSEVEAKLGVVSQTSAPSLAEMAAQMSVEDEPRRADVAPISLAPPARIETPAPPVEEQTSHTQPPPAAPADEFELPVLDDEEQVAGAVADAVWDDLPLAKEPTAAAENVTTPVEGKDKLRFDAAHAQIAPPVLDEIPATPVFDTATQPETIDLKAVTPAASGDPLDVLFESDDEPAAVDEAAPSVPVEVAPAVGVAEQATAPLQAVTAPPPAVTVPPPVVTTPQDQPAVTPPAPPSAAPPPSPTTDLGSDPLHRAKQLMQAGEIVAALDEVDSALDGDPDHQPARQLKALLLIQAGQLDDARDWLKETIRLAPQQEPAWLLLSRVYEEAGQLDSALKCLDRALALNPRRASTHAALGNILASLQRTDEALAAYRTALRYDPAINTERFRLRHHWSNVEQRRPQA